MGNKTRNHVFWLVQGSFLTHLGCTASCPDSTATPEQLPLHARQRSLPSTLGIASWNPAFSCCQWNCDLLVKGDTRIMSPGAHFFLFVFVFLVTHNKICGELFGINYFSSVLQRLNALGGIFLKFWGSSQLIFNIKDATASVSRMEKLKLLSVGLQTQSLHLKQLCLQFSSMMDLLTFLCCQC